MPREARELRDHRLTIRIPQRIRDALEAQATRERRTVADVANNLFEAHYPASASRERRRR
jgi:hypothetical protein